MAASLLRSSCTRTVRWVAISRGLTKETKVLLLGKLAPKAVTAALSTADRRKGVFVQI